MEKKMDQPHRRRMDGKGEFYREEILKIGMSLYEKCEVPLNFFYRLFKNHRLNTFSMILLHCEWEKVREFLQIQKRTSDLLVPIEEEKGVHLLLCQETEVDGGVYFVERLRRSLKERGVEESMSAAVIGVENTRYPIDELPFIMLDSFVKVFQEKDRLVHRTIH